MNQLFIKKHVSYLFFLLLMGMLMNVSLTASAETITTTLEVESGTDISKPLQQALNEAQYAPAGTSYKIIIPKGSYNISQSIRIFSNTTISMKDAVLNRIGKDFVLLRTDDTKAMTKYSGVENISLEGGTLNGNAFSKPLLRLCHGQNITVKNVVFTKVKNSHHLEMAAIKNATIKGCTFSNYSGKSTDNVEALQIDIMHPNHFANYLSYDDTPCQNITVTNCKFKKVQRGVGSHSGILGSYFNNITITNNTFDDVTGYAIVTTNYTNSKVNNNTIRNCGSGILVRAMTTEQKAFYLPKSGSFKVTKKVNIQIQNNTIDVTANGYPNLPYGIALMADKLTSPINGIPAKDYRISGLTVSKNNITLGCTGLALRLQGICSSKITNNTITCNIKKAGYKKLGSGDGIRVEKSTGNHITGNIITNKRKTGYANQMRGINVRVNSDKNIISGNTVKGASVDGIKIGNCKNVTVKNNKVSSSGRYDILVDGQEGPTTVISSGNKVKTEKAASGAVIK